ncbi:lysophospholipase [Paenibacillus spiritus]|uniref:Lysophospholipase n=1 Tax=Paenibacillus spiritus TaxID=2496557 RepID=A0A5J5G525_9BACL|nr:GDSL-type esterase/lipase family protein [Paenibacillus spiritus]KAA9002370.1 lysophospholipase [Paenibacillus spiritus]
MVYQYTALGDSLTTGFGALPGNGFVPLYRRMTEARLRSFVAHTNLGINGLTTTELLWYIQRNAMFRQAIREADVITVSIGGNDLIRAARSARGNGAAALPLGAVHEATRHYGEIMQAIGSIKAQDGRPYLLRTVGLYNPYPRWAEAAEWVRHFNRHAGRYSSRTSGFADIYGAFAGSERELLSLDGLHPNGRGYRVIAERLNALGYSPLV